MQIYVYFLIMQKIIVIFVVRIESYVAENTDRMDIFSDYRRSFFVHHRARLFRIWTRSIYIGGLCYPCISRIHQYFKL